MLRDGFQGVSARCPRCIRIQMILEDLSLHLLQPRLEKPGLPEPRQMVGGVGSLEVFIGGVLSVCVGGAECRRGGWPELVARGEDPRMPSARQRCDRAGTTPDSRCGGKRSRERLIGTVAVCIRDHGL